MTYQKSGVRSRKSAAGFTMVELMITMVVFVLAIAAASQIFTKLLTQFKQQSRIAETNIEGIVGLDLLRQDIEHAGMGLPWNMNGAAYNEVAGDVTYNDAPGNPPRAVMSGIAADGSDYLVIKSSSASSLSTAGKSTHLSSDGSVRVWGLNTDDLINADQVIVISPGSTSANSRTLVVSGGSYYTSFNNVSLYAPPDDTDVRLVYGISSAGALRAPFNRSDYYLSANNPLSKIIVPTRCAPGTSVLVRATLNQGNGALDETPILDCVADFQVVYHLDTNNDGILEPPTNSISALTAQQIRDQLKNVEVYILAQEGQKDTTFTFNNFTPAAPLVRLGIGRDFDLSSIDPDYVMYRWKVYTISVQTGNLE